MGSSDQSGQNTNTICSLLMLKKSENLKLTKETELLNKLSPQIFEACTYQQRIWSLVLHCSIL